MPVYLSNKTPKAGEVPFLFDTSGLVLSAFSLEEHILDQKRIMPAPLPFIAAYVVMGLYSMFSLPP